MGIPDLPRWKQLFKSDAGDNNDDNDGDDEGAVTGSIFVLLSPVTVLCCSCSFTPSSVWLQSLTSSWRWSGVSISRSRLHRPLGSSDKGCRNFKEAVDYGGVDLLGVQARYDWLLWRKEGSELILMTNAKPSKQFLADRWSQGNQAWHKPCFRDVTRIQTALKFNNGDPWAHLLIWNSLQIQNTKFIVQIGLFLKVHAKLTILNSYDDSRKVCPDLPDLNDEPANDTL